jgi:hypothetical protein
MSRHLQVIEGYKVQVGGGGTGAEIHLWYRTVTSNIQVLQYLSRSVWRSNTPVHLGILDVLEYLRTRSGAACYQVAVIRQKPYQYKYQQQFKHYSIQ